jgi:succinyl-diaminopimelate desuccinylase
LTLSATLELARDLIRRSSVTPNDAGCQQLMIQRLNSCGFNTEPLRYGEVDNFWAEIGTTGPLLAFAGHTDVVPTGPENEWYHPPFSGVVADGILHGRGAADMKGSLAAMITAAQRFVVKHPNFSGRLGFLITSDEEGPAINGTKRVMEHLQNNGIHIDYCIVGEPSSSKTVGDVVKAGRRGSLNGNMQIKGKQGHVAYPQLALNPVPPSARFIAAMDTIEWDKGNEVFPPTTFQISNINGGTGASNVIPGQVDIQFNFRFSPESSPESLQQRVAALCEELKLDCEIEWGLSGMPFQTGHGELLQAVSKAIKNQTGTTTIPSTAGGTSDGRFIAPYGTQVVELGPCNDTIHKVNEQVSGADLDTLSLIYEEIMSSLLVKTPKSTTDQSPHSEFP